VTETHIS